MTIQMSDVKSDEESKVYSDSGDSVIPTNFPIRTVYCKRCDITVKTNIAGPRCIQCKGQMITQFRANDVKNELVK